MLEVLVNAARVVLSKEVREGASSLVDLVTKMPEWQQDICTLKAEVPRASREQCRFLADLSISKMLALPAPFPAEACEALNACLIEATDNAFEHACRRDTDRISVVTDICRAYASFAVTNPKRRRFNLDRCLQAGESGVKTDPSVRRGRGLLVIAELADGLSSIGKGSGIKAVFYHDRVEVQVNVFDSLTVLTTKSGAYNESLGRRLIALVKRHSANDILLDFSPCRSDLTKTTSVILEAEAIVASSERRLVALVASSGAVVIHILPRELVTCDVRDALERLDRADLYPEVSKTIRELGCIPTY